MTDSDITRRRVLALGGAAAGAVLGLGISSCSSPARDLHGSGSPETASPTPGGELCVLSPGVPAGPYHREGALFRRDITEGKKGVPLTVRLTVRDEPHACAPLKGAAVEIWHCDAWGYYSGYPAAHPGGSVPPADRESGGADPNTYLRGFRTTDARGVAEFVTIFPGWHTPRAPHVHVEVHTGGGRAGRTYAGGRVNWTGQLFFDDRCADAVYARAPYSRHTGERTRLERDTVYGGGGARDGLMTVTGDVDKGFVATLTVGIDTTRQDTGAGTDGDGSRPPRSPSSPTTSGDPSSHTRTGATASPSADATTSGTPPPDSAASASRTPTP